MNLNLIRYTYMLYSIYLADGVVDELITYQVVTVIVKYTAVILNNLWVMV